MNNKFIILSAISVDLYTISYSGLVRQWQRKYIVIHLTTGTVAQKYRNELLNASYIDNKSANSDPLLQTPPPQISYFRNYLEHSKHFP